MAIPEDLNNAEATTEETCLRTVNPPRCDEESQLLTIHCPRTIVSPLEEEESQPPTIFSPLTILNPWTFFSPRDDEESQPPTIFSPLTILNPWTFFSPWEDEEAQPEEDMLSSEGEVENEIARAESTSGYRYQGNPETTVRVEDVNEGDHANDETDQSSLQRDSTSRKKFVGEPVKTSRDPSNLNEEKKARYCYFPEVLQHSLLMVCYLQRSPLAWKIIMTMYLGCLFGSSSASQTVTLKQGSQGAINFYISCSPRDNFPYFTVRQESEELPFCTVGQLSFEGLTHPSQYSRFSCQCTKTDNVIHVIIIISDVSPEDAGVYILTWRSVGVGSNNTIRLNVELSYQPPARARCTILKVSERNANFQADIYCTAVADRVNASLVCYENGMKMSYEGKIHNDGQYIRGRFAIKSINSTIHCCSYVYDTPINESICRDFVFSPQESAYENNRVATSGYSSTYKSDCDCYLHKRSIYTYIWVVLFVYCMQYFLVIPFEIFVL